VLDVGIVNASPIIFLSRAGHLSLLEGFYRSVLVPSQVANELGARGDADASALALASTSWLVQVEVTDIPLSVERWGLGPGESSVLALALQTPSSEVILDDLAGRKCALSLGLDVRGTLGLVLLAKLRGHVPLARPILEALLETGMYLSRSVLDRALERVGE
jgi:predicted nucleic acid-binding protein